jgi:HAE1 family hydrophobic/amphiphilic exporter-1
MVVLELENTNINIKYNAFDRKSIADVSNLIFINDMGQQIKLNQFATVTVLAQVN